MGLFIYFMHYFVVYYYCYFYSINVSSTVIYNDTVSYSFYSYLSCCFSSF